MVVLDDIALNPDWDSFTLKTTSVGSGILPRDTTGKTMLFRVLTVCAKVPSLGPTPSLPPCSNRPAGPPNRLVLETPNLYSRNTPPSGSSRAAGI